jgi:hypothetical protein
VHHPLRPLHLDIGATTEPRFSPGSRSVT